MGIESWTKSITHNGETIEITFIRRPFREGLEAIARFRGKEVRIAELGLGENALIERIIKELS